MFNKPALPRIIPFAIYILFLIFEDFLAHSNALSINIRWLYFVKIIAVIVALAYFLKNYTELAKKPPLTDFLYATVSGVIVFLVWIFPYPDWLVATAPVSFNPSLGQTDIETILWLSTRMLGAALIVPIMEELFWRSYIMRRYDSENFLSVNPETLSSFAYVGSACLFALEHKLWLAGLFAGLVYGELYKTYKNLWVPIFAHAVTNAMLGTWVILTGNWQYW